MAHDLKLKWSKRALADISRIIEYIAQDKLIAGQQFAAILLPDCPISCKLPTD